MLSNLNLRLATNFVRTNMKIICGGRTGDDGVPTYRTGACTLIANDHIDPDTFAI